MMHGQKNIKILSIVSICVILPQDSFTSGIAHINNVQQIQMHHSSKYNFHTSLVQISWSLITLFPKWLPVKGSKRYMNFLECTVVVNLPTVTIPLNLQHVAMWWPSVNDSWVMGVTRTLSCKVASLSTITELSKSHFNDSFVSFSAETQFKIHFTYVFCKRMRSQSHQQNFTVIYMIFSYIYKLRELDDGHVRPKMQLWLTIK